MINLKPGDAIICSRFKGNGNYTWCNQFEQVIGKVVYVKSIDLINKHNQRVFIHWEHLPNTQNMHGSIIFLYLMLKKFHSLKIN